MTSKPSANKKASNNPQRASKKQKHESITRKISCIRCSSEGEGSRCLSLFPTDLQRTEHRGANERQEGADVWKQQLYGPHKPS